VDSLFFLIPVSIVLVILVTLVFLWAVRSGQFDDLEGPAHSILHEEEEELDSTKETESPSDVSDGQKDSVD